MTHRWYLVDGIGPFFAPVGGEPGGGEPVRRYNWSKIPFVDLEKGCELDDRYLSRVVQDFATFCGRVSELGFNAITVDDVAHMVLDDDYPIELDRRLRAYRELYDELFKIAVSEGLAVFVTSDVVFSHGSGANGAGSEKSRLRRFAEQLRWLLDDRPEVQGVILRFGESDGRDVRGDFRSDLTLKTPRSARNFLASLLPDFEQRDRLLVFRTWSVGAYSLGDLMWNRETFDKVFGSIHSPNLVLSMKYGESDFFRYLPLNRHFFRSDHQKIVEFQARREYEGFGEFPSFVGWEYERFRDQLAEARNLIGVSIWCQTGGWTRFRRRTYLSDSSVWNELNTEVTLDLFRRGGSTEAAVERFARKRRAPEEGEVGDSAGRRTAAMLALLRLSDEVIRELLYIEPAARRKMFFRRLRLPPLFHVYWDNILINHPVRKLLRTLVEDGSAMVNQGFNALSKVDRMQDLASASDLPIEDVIFQRSTFEILAHSRRYYFLPFDASLRSDLRDLKSHYESQFPLGYSIHLNFEPMRLKRRNLSRGLDLLLRDQRGYRWVDHVLTLRLLSAVYPLCRPFVTTALPDFARRETMGIDTLFQ